MAVIADRLIETSQTTGTGPYSLEGPQTGNRSFVAALGNGAQCWYTAQREDGSKFEFGLGTVTDGTPDTLTRDSIITSSNADAAVDWQGGDTPIFIYTAASGDLLDKLYHGRARHVVGGGTANAITFDPTPKWTSYQAGNSIRVKLAATNSSTSVVANGSSLGDKPVKMPDGNDPPVGSLIADSVVEFVYDAVSDVLIAIAGAETRTIAIDAVEARQVGARVTHSAAQSIPNNTFTAVAFNTEDWDTDTIHDNATNNSRLTAKTAGKYLVTAYCIFAVSGTGRRIGRILKNGTSSEARAEWVINSIIDPAINITAVVDMAVNDYVELEVFQTSGGALNVVMTDGSPRFAMQRIAP